MNRSINPVQIYLKVVSFLYIVLFVYTAISKLIHIELFHIRYEKFPFVSDYASWITWGVPFTEIAIAVLFLFPKYILTALYASLSLMSVFTIYIISVLKFSDYIPCSCGGVISAMGWKDHILFNSAFIALAIIGILLISNNKNHSISKKTT